MKEYKKRKYKIEYLDQFGDYIYIEDDNDLMFAYQYALLNR